MVIGNPNFFLAHGCSTCLGTLFFGKENMPILLLLLLTNHCIKVHSVSVEYQMSVDYNDIFFLNHFQV